MFWAHVRMLPRLDAERQRTQIYTQLAANDRTLDDQAHDQLLGELDRIAAGEEEAPRRAAPDTALLASFGVQRITHEVPARAPDGGGESGK